MWKACENALPTMQNLRKRGVATDGVCPICGNEAESICHALFKSNFAKNVWSRWKKCLIKICWLWKKCRKPRFWYGFWLAMDSGILLEKDLGFQQIIIESDSLLAAQSISTKIINGETGHIVQGMLCNLDCFGS